MGPENEVFREAAISSDDELPLNTLIITNNGIKQNNNGDEDAEDDPLDYQSNSIVESIYSSSAKNLLDQRPNQEIISLMNNGLKIQIDKSLIKNHNHYQQLRTNKTTKTATIKAEKMFSKDKRNNHLLKHNNVNNYHKEIFDEMSLMLPLKANKHEKMSNMNGFYHHEYDEKHDYDDDDIVEKTNINEYKCQNGTSIISNNLIKINGNCKFYLNNSSLCQKQERKHCPEVLRKNENNCLKLSTKTPNLSTNDNSKFSYEFSMNSTPNCNLNYFEKPSLCIAFLSYLSFAVLILFGYIREFLRRTGFEKSSLAREKNRENYNTLYKSFESFYTQNVYRRICDAWNRPIASVPGAEIDILDRISYDYNCSFSYPGTKTRCINMGSYNYLGYAEISGQIHEQIIDTIQQYGVSVGSTRNEFGYNVHVQQLEQLMAKFLNVESCIVFGMGFATNSTNIQCFADKGCLILSDEKNHSSLILGCRLSGATVKVFKHNNMKDLELKLCKYIIEGQPKTRQPWKKIITIVEGIYSMEGTIVNLPELIRLKKKYKFFIYLDEAHSIGALGPNGRGVIDYYGCNPADVDILMGTFTKSFGAAGGYLAGTENVINAVRLRSYCNYYATSMSPPIAKQIICVLNSLSQEDGQIRIKRLAYNTRYFRKKLKEMGFIIYGHDDSPVVPLLICFFAKIAAVIRMAHDKGLGLIGAGYPATPLGTGRVRFCISAAHTKEMLDRALEVMDEIGDKIGIKYLACKNAK